MSHYLPVGSRPIIPPFWHFHMFMLIFSLPTLFFVADIVFDCFHSEPGLQRARPDSLHAAPASSATTRELGVAMVNLTMLCIIRMVKAIWDQENDHVTCYCLNPNFWKEEFTNSALKLIAIAITRSGFCYCYCYWYKYLIAIIDFASLQPTISGMFMIFWRQKHLRETQERPERSWPWLQFGSASSFWDEGSLNNIAW